MAEKDSSLAVLIDAENARASLVGSLFEVIAEIGVASVRRIYGDFMSPHLKAWQEQLLVHSLQPVQTFAGAKGKNSTDIALVIDAMDLLHTKQLDGFCLVSSDSDFTRLASRIREEGIPVYGFGLENTPKSFVNACYRFTYIESLEARRSHGAQSPSRGRVPIKQLISAVRGAVDESGWAHLGQVGDVIRRMVPDFDNRHYGYNSLSALVEATGVFKVERRGANGGPQTVFVQPK